MNNRLYLTTGKRCLDVLCSSAGLVVLFPILLIVAVWITISSSGPVFFRQVRIGQFGHPFRIWKFRTMVAASDRHDDFITADDDSRITAVGRWLRKTKLDELPQLINVFVGEMSLVGPRPEVIQYLDAYQGIYRQILLAKPGITGPAANAFVREEEILSGRPDKRSYYLMTILPEKFQLDLDYCDDICFTKDLGLILQTFTNVFEKPVLLRGTWVRHPEKRYLKHKSSTSNELLKSQ